MVVPSLLEVFIQIFKFNISVKVNGGGWSSQTEAIRLAVGRCLVEVSKPLKEKFLKKFEI
mgnify:CR=1 FL=1